jgi:hypothetical protein
MNSKERARIAMTSGVPDRVPLGDFAIDYDTAARILGHETYHRAKARCQIAYWEGRRDEVVEGLIADTIALYRALDVYDIVNLASMTLGLVPPKGYRPEAPRRVDEVTWEYADGRVLKYSPLTGDITLVHDPHAWTRFIVAEDYPLTWDDAAPDPSVYQLVDAVAAAFPDRFVIGPFPTGAQWPQTGSMARTLVLMAEDPELYERIVRSSLAQAAALQARWRNPGCDATMDGTDWASGKGTMMSPRMWRRFLYPALAANVRAAHAHGLLYVQHACGNNWGILDGFLEAGVDCYQSVQASAGMDLGAVKQHVAGRMAVWGGVRVENLVSGTPDEVRADVRAAMAAAKEGGGFILGATHSIAVGTSYDCFMAMLDEFVRLREY